MRIADALQSSEISPLDAEVLLAASLGKNRAWLITHAEEELSDSMERTWLTFQMRRMKGEPVAYIIGKREFYGRTFTVDPRVHIPRPSTENLITLVLDTLQRPEDAVRLIEPGTVGVVRLFGEIPHTITLVDVGTGSGCIAITLALECPDRRVIAIDQSEDALACAQENAERLGARVEFRQGDLLSPLEKEQAPFLIVSNPPYVKVGTIEGNPELSFEPREALEAGSDGMAVIRRLLAQARAHPHCTGIILECMTEQFGAF